jgi:hypothetical protein
MSYRDPVGANRGAQEAGVVQQRGWVIVGVGHQGMVPESASTRNMIWLPLAIDLASPPLRSLLSSLIGARDL